MTLPLMLLLISGVAAAHASTLDPPATPRAAGTRREKPAGVLRFEGMSFCGDIAVLVGHDLPAAGAPSDRPTACIWIYANGAWTRACQGMEDRR